MLRSVLILIFGIILMRPTDGYTESNPEVTSRVRQDMASVYTAFRDLQKYMVSKERFSDPQNENDILLLLKTMSARFHKVERLDAKYSKEPGFISTIKIINDMIDDVKNRFAEGKKEYALWRLKATSNYCVTCHTRHEVRADFSDSGVSLEGLSDYEKGEFYLATRQFDKARDSFLAAAQDSRNPFQRIEALKNWLVIYTRVHPDPQEAIVQINRIRSRAKLSQADDAELASWLNSLRRWQNESKVKVDPLRRADHLIAQGLALSDSTADAKGAVEFLRATSLLHQMMESPTKINEAERAKVLYLLGLAYSHLQSIFITELPEVFLEQCIRDYPDTDYARRSYKIYYDLISLGYTGSGGLQLPDDVKLNLKELHDLAFGLSTATDGQV